MIELVLRIGFSLLVVFGLMWGLARLARRPLSGPRRPARWPCCNRQQLSRGSSVAVVKVADRALVLGVTDQQVSLLAETDLGSVREHPTRPSGATAGALVPLTPASHGPRSARAHPAAHRPRPAGRVAALAAHVAARPWTSCATGRDGADWRAFCSLLACLASRSCCWAGLAAAGRGGAGAGRSAAPAARPAARRPGRRPPSPRPVPPSGGSHQRQHRRYESGGSKPGHLARHRAGPDPALGRAGAAAADDRFTKVFMVLGITRNALGLTSVPPNQVLAGLALFISLFIMGPTCRPGEHAGRAALPEGRQDPVAGVQRRREAAARVHVQAPPATDEIALLLKVVRPGAAGEPGRRRR